MLGDSLAQLWKQRQDKKQDGDHIHRNHGLMAVMKRMIDDQNARMILQHSQSIQLHHLSCEFPGALKGAQIKVPCFNYALLLS